MNSECKCGNNVCALRLARGLKAFCDPTLTASRAGNPGYASYALAVAANPGKRIQRISGGLGTGSHARFGVVS